MSTDSPTDVPAAADASDVVTGPVGNARLQDPAASGPEGAELDRLPAIDVDRHAAADEPTAPIRQLEGIIQNLTTFATPVLREIAARAAELAARAALAAGPVAHRAAAVTEDVGGRIAVKSREVASELRDGAALRPSVVGDEPSAATDAVEPGLSPRP